MLTLAPAATFPVSVRIHVPGGDDVPVQFTCSHKGKAALGDFVSRASSMGDLEAVSEIVTGWVGVDAEFDRDNLAAMLDAYPTAAVAILEAYLAEIGKAAAKN
jgi:hypothetical protein